MERINAFLSLGLPEIAALFAPFETSLTVLGVTPLSESMGNSGYAVETDAGKFFLKIYSNATDGTEAASYAYWREQTARPAVVLPRWKQKARFRTRIRLRSGFPACRSSASCGSRGNSRRNWPARPGGCAACSIRGNIRTTLCWTKG